MPRYVVRFQLQSGSKELDSKVYFDDYEPCSENAALKKLAELWSNNREYFGGYEWNAVFKEAIERAERAVKQGYNASAAENRNFYSTTFDSRGDRYRVDVAIEAGSGHFR